MLQRRSTSAPARTGHPRDTSQKGGRRELVAEGGAIEVLALMAWFGAGQGETARQRGSWPGDPAPKRRLDAAIKSTATLVRKRSFQGGGSATAKPIA